MAEAGDVFRFFTDKVAAEHGKNKFHIAIDLSIGAFLFINSNPFEGAMPISRSDWPEMPKMESFISFSGLIRYSKEDMRGIKIEPAGAITVDCLRRIRDHAVESLVMPQEDIDALCAVIALKID